MRRPGQPRRCHEGAEGAQTSNNPINSASSYDDATLGNLSSIALTSVPAQSID
jgi:hypothetical protein